MIIEIPFKDYWKYKMINNIKTCTSRNKRYGLPGDRFKQFDTWFELTDVYQVTLLNVKSNFYQQEGCNTPEEFEQIWNQIHPIKKFVPEQIVWLHEFKKVED